MDNQINDLMYCSKDEISKEILQKWPEAVLTEEWDEIHEYRTQVQISESKREWYKFLIEKDMAGISFRIQLDLRASKESLALIKSIMDEMHPGWDKK